MNGWMDGMSGQGCEQDVVWGWDGLRWLDWVGKGDGVGEDVKFGRVGLG